MKFDLHCHSLASDGQLPPEELIKLAEQENLDLFSITDHDTIAGYQQVRGKPMRMSLVPGIELSAVWAGMGIHIIGLDFDPDHPVILSAIEYQQNIRVERAKVIDEKLSKIGMPNTLEGALKYSSAAGQVGRPHFASYLVEKGYVKKEQHAFDKWLGNGKLCDVKSGWPSVEQAVGWVVEAGGVPVLAHPFVYKMTFTKLKRLIGDFKNAGGEAVELLEGQVDKQKRRALVEYVAAQGLAGSGGSDFHKPEWHWAQLGKLDPMPDKVTPVWKLFKRTKIDS